MTSRERVIRTIEHREPDRVPLDIGSNVMSGIMGHALDRLRKYLDLEKRKSTARLGNRPPAARPGRPAESRYAESLLKGRIAWLAS